MNTSTAPSVEHEWSLFDHLSFLLRAWPWLLLGASIGGAGSFGIARLLPTVYSAEGLIRVGTAYLVGDLEKAPDVATRIGSAAFLAELEDEATPDNPAKNPESGEEEPVTVALQASCPQGSTLVQLTATSRDPDRAKQVIERAANRIRASHAALHQKIENILGDRIREIDLQLSGLEQAVSRVPQSTDSAATAFAESRRDTLLNQMARLRSARLDLRLRRDPEVMRLTELVDGPSLHQQRPSRKLPLVGALAGLLFVAFALYFVADRRRQQGPEAEASSPRS